MIALIIVSHCHDIAEGVCRLAGEMTQTPVPIAGVGGIVGEDGQRQIGTDATAVLEAIESCWRPAGVLILVDLGSAILSAETALELLPDEQRERCLISNAPLVEGAVVAPWKPAWATVSKTSTAPPKRCETWIRCYASG